MRQTFFHQVTRPAAYSLLCLSRSARLAEKISFLLLNSSVVAYFLPFLLAKLRNLSSEAREIPRMAARTKSDLTNTSHDLSE